MLRQAAELGPAPGVAPSCSAHLACSAHLGEQAVPQRRTAEGGLCLVVHAVRAAGPDLDRL